MKKILIGLFAIGLLAYNCSLERKAEKSMDLTAYNIVLLQANASEMWCDATNTTDCYIGSAKGTGYLRSKD